DLGRAESVAEKLGHHPRRRVGIGKAAQRPDRFRPPFGERQRRMQSPVAGEARQERVRKAEGRSRSARRYIKHELEILSRFARRLPQKPRKENGGGHALRNGAKPRRRLTFCVNAQGCAAMVLKCRANSS